MGGVLFKRKLMVAAFAILILSVFVSQYIMLGAIKQLSDEDRLKLMSNRQLNRVQRRFIIMMAIVGLYYLSLTLLPEYMMYLLALFILFIAVERIYTIVITKKKIAALGLPDFYIKKYTAASIIGSIGMVLFFVLLFRDLF